MSGFRLGYAVECKPKPQCWCGLIHGPTCPSKALTIHDLKRLKSHCVFNCSKCYNLKIANKKDNPCKCPHCSAINLHHPNSCALKERDEVRLNKRGKCIFNCQRCQLKPMKGPHVCRFCGFTNNHVTDKCPIVRGEDIIRVNMSI
jgi:hypothetical protein